MGSRLPPIGHRPPRRTKRPQRRSFASSRTYALSGNGVGGGRVEIGASPLVAMVPRAVHVSSLRISPIKPNPSLNSPGCSSCLARPRSVTEKRKVKTFQEEAVPDLLDQIQAGLLARLRHPDSVEIA